MTLDNILSRGLALQPYLGIGNHPVDPPGEVWDKSVGPPQTWVKGGAGGYVRKVPIVFSA